MSGALLIALLACALFAHSLPLPQPIQHIAFPSDFDPAEALILCDLDGTLLDQHHSVSEENIAAIRRVVERGFRFVPATGRTRPSMLNAVGQSFVRELFGDISRTPGVYQQGQVVYGLDGKIIYERVLDTDVITSVLAFCESRGLTVVAYTAEEVYCAKQNEYTDRVMAYKDPAPIVFADGLDKLHAIGVNVNKLIILTDPGRIAAVRSEIEPLMSSRASFTQAVPEMLEILPLGGCKGDGVRRLLEHIGVSAERAIAFGDGENDVEMIDLVRYGVAVANAKPKLKAVAKFETVSNVNNGVAVGLEAVLKSLDALEPVPFLLASEETS